MNKPRCQECLRTITHFRRDKERGNLLLMLCERPDCNTTHKVRWEYIFGNDDLSKQRVREAIKKCTQDTDPLGEAINPVDLLKELAL